MIAKITRKKKSNRLIKKEFLDSLREYDDLEEPGLDVRADAIIDPLEAVRIIQRCEEIKIQNKRVIGYVRKELLKEFREAEQVFESVGHRKSAVYFKIELYKVLKRYPTIKKSSLSSNYFRKNFNIIKAVCKNNLNLFS